MPDAPPSAAGSLSARAQEILRRANAQLAERRAPARNASPAPPPSAPPAPPVADRSRPADLSDLGELLDTVEAGIGAARAHLVALSASLERIGHELAAVTETRPETPPPRAPRATPASRAPRDAAWLVAVEMAVAGDSRADAGRRLREEFGIADPTAILDEAFGPQPPAPRRAYGP